jgi:hypothetical protein
MSISTKYLQEKINYLEKCEILNTIYSFVSFYQEDIEKIILSIIVKLEDILPSLESQKKLAEINKYHSITQSRWSELIEEYKNILIGIKYLKDNVHDIITEKITFVKEIHIKLDCKLKTQINIIRDVILYIEQYQQYQQQQQQQQEQQEQHENDIKCEFIEDKFSNVCEILNDIAFDIYENMDFHNIIKKLFMSTLSLSLAFDEIRSQERVNLNKLSLWNKNFDTINDYNNPLWPDKWIVNRILCDLMYDTSLYYQMEDTKSISIITPINYAEGEIGYEPIDNVITAMNDIITFI